MRILKELWEKWETENLRHSDESLVGFAHWRVNPIISLCLCRTKMPSSVWFSSRAGFTGWPVTTRPREYWPPTGSSKYCFCLGQIIKCLLCMLQENSIFPPHILSKKMQQNCVQYKSMGYEAWSYFKGQLVGLSQKWTVKSHYVIRDIHMEKCTIHCPASLVIGSSDISAVPE